MKELPDLISPERWLTGNLLGRQHYGKAQQQGGLYEPLLPREPELKYGKQYEFGSVLQI